MTQNIRSSDVRGEKFIDGNSPDAENSVHIYPLLTFKIENGYAELLAGDV